MEENIVINLETNIGDIAKSLDVVISKMDSVSEKLGNESLAYARELMDSSKNNIGKASEDTFSILSGLSPYASSKINTVRDSIADIKKALSVNTSDETFLSNLNQQSALLASSLTDLLASFELLHNATGKLTQDQKQITSSAIPSISESVFKVISTFTGKHGTGTPSQSTLMRTLFENPRFKSGYNSFQQATQLSDANQKELFAALASFVTPFNKKHEYYDYARKHSQGTLNKKNVEKYYNSYKDHLPDSMQSLPTMPIEVKKRDIDRNATALYNQTVSKQEYMRLKRLARDNEVFRETLLNLGYGKYTSTAKEAGVFRMVSRNALSRGALAQIAGSVFYDKIKPAIEGNAVYHISLDNESELDQRRIANRGNERAVQGFEAVNVIQEINNGLLPLYMKEQYNHVTGKRPFRTRVGQVERPRKDSFVVLSQTPEDFMTGTLPEKNEINYNWKKRHLNGTSNYIMFERSRITELAGMHGNGTFGDGVIGNVADHPEMAQHPKLIMLDYSDKITPKTENGELDYDAVKKEQWSKQASEEVSQLFTPNKALKYTYGDKELSYNYPSKTRILNGEEQTYVPIAVKGGGVLMMEEAQYRSASKESLELYGANIFDNFESPDATYNYFKDANKIFEARNRLLTPSIPFSEVGGKIPKFDKIAAVDMNAAFGIDGAIFAMPGYVPGKNATIRMPGLNLKGVMQTFDWKQAIKDIYSLKDNEAFYLPGLNTPKELLNLYKEGGMQAIQASKNWGGSEYQKTLDDYFVDIMQMDMLIGDSLIKSPIFGVNDNGGDSNKISDKISGKKANDLLRERMKKMPDGDLFRLVETASEHSSTHQLALSTQMSQHLALTKKDYKKNQELWNKHIERLENNVEYQKRHVFNTQDKTDVEFRNNPTILETNSAARTRLNESINAAKESMRAGKLFGRGNGSKIAMYMALANPGVFMLSAAKANGYKGNDFEKAFDMKEDMIAGAPIANVLSLGGGRFPANMLEELPLQKFDEFNKMILQGKYGLGKDALYMNPETIAKMGGGDFDGDQVQIVTGWIAEAFKQTANLRFDKIKSYTKEEAEKEAEKIMMPKNEKGKQTRTPSLIADFLGRSVVSSIFMGQVSNAMDSLSEINWDDENVVKEFAQAAVNLRKFYDIDSTYAKTGILKQLSHGDKTLDALLLGRPFTSVYKGMHEALESGDFTKMADFSRVNFASIYSNKTGVMMGALRGIPDDKKTYEEMIKAQRNIQGITQDIPLNGEANSIEEARAMFLDRNIKAFSEQLLYGKVLSDETISGLESSLNLYSEKVDKELHSITKTDDIGRREQLKRFEIEIGRQRRRLLFLKDYGVTEHNRNEQLGIAGLGMLDDTLLTGQTDAFGEGLQKRDQEIDMANLAELRKNAANTLQYASMLAEIVDTLPNGLTPKQVLTERRVKAIRTANDMNYAYTMLSAFNATDDAPQKQKEKAKRKWHNQYVLGNRSNETNANAILGIAAHAAFETYGKAQMEGSQISSEELENKFVEKLLSPGVNEKTYFKKNDKTGQIEVINGESKVNDRVQAALNNIRNFDKIFADWEFLAVEGETNLGNLAPKKIGDQETPVNTNGRFDAILRHRTNEQTVLVDFKGNTDDKDGKQLMMYAAGQMPEGVLPDGMKRVDKVGYLSYLVNLPEGTRKVGEQTLPLEYGLFSKTMDVTDNSIKEVVKYITDTVNDIQALAKLGFNSQTMVRAEQRWVGARNFSAEEQAAFIEGEIREIFAEHDADGKYRERHRGKLRSGNFTKNQINNMNREDIDEAIINMELQKRIDGGGMEGFIATQQKYDKLKELSDKVNNVASTVTSVAYRTKRQWDKETPNQWVLWEQQLDAAKAQTESMYGAKLITKEQAELYGKDIDNARLMYHNALKETAAVDMDIAARDIEHALLSPNNETATSRFDSQNTSLTNKFKHATQAYKAMLGQVIYKKDNDGQFIKGDDGEYVIDEEKSPIKSADAKLAKESYEHLYDVVDKMKAQIVQRSVEAFDADFQKMYDASTTGRVDKTTQVKKAISDFKSHLTDANMQLELDYKDGYLKDNTEEYERRKAKLAEIDPEKYANVLYNQEQKANERQLRQFEKYQRNSRLNKRSLSSQMYERRLDNIDALKQYKESFSDSKKVWEERQAAIKADWINKHGANDDGYKGLDSYQQATSMVQKYASAMSDAQKQLDQFGNKHAKVASGIDAMQASINNMLTMYLRRLARQLVQQAAQFVKAYDAAITEIQVVTRKTDEEVEKLGEDMLQVAKDLKVSFADVAKATTELYRQGLNDEEVNERREQVLKFSKVSGVSATDATKLITVGLNSGLFSNARQVTDVVTALGDNAATNADQIQKGIQKAGYAAKDAGVSGEELAAMLTVITSGTQLSGNVAGTTLRNVLSRMNRVKNSDTIVYGDDGSAISQSALSSVLTSVGVRMYDEDLQQRGSVEILTDLGKVWDDLSDTKKNQIAYQMAGTEQYSNFIALMSGFSEQDENGQTLMEKYLELAKDSDGIVDSKYQDQMESLAASFTNLTNSFNNLVASLTDTGIIQTVVNGFSTILDVVTNIINVIGDASDYLLMLAGVVALFASGPLGIVVGSALIAAGVAGSDFLGLGKILRFKIPEEDVRARADKHKTEQQENHEYENNLINQLKEVQGRMEQGTATNADLEEFNQIAQQLRDMGYEFDFTISSIDDLAVAASNAADAIEGLNAQEEQRRKQSDVDFLSSSANSFASNKPKNESETVQEKVTNWVYGQTDESYFETATQLYNAFNNRELDDIVLTQDVQLATQGLAKKNIVLEKGTSIGDFFITYPQASYKGNGIYDIDGSQYYIDPVVMSSDVVQSSYATENGGPNINQPFQIVDKNHIIEMYNGVDIFSKSGYVDEIADYMVNELNNNWSELSKLYDENNNEQFNKAIYGLMIEPFLDDSGYFSQEKIIDFVSENNLLSDQVIETEKSNSINIATEAYAASLMSPTNGKYGNIPWQMYQAWANAEGETASDKYNNFAEFLSTIPAEVLGSMIGDTENPELAQALTSVYDIIDGENGKEFVVKNDLKDADYDAIGQAIASLNESQLSALVYRGQKTISTSALNAFDWLRNEENRSDAWVTFGTDTDTSANRTARADLKTILGEEVLNGFLNDEYSEIGEEYLRRKIAVYGTDNEIYNGIEYATTAEQILQGIDSAEDPSAYLDTLPQKLLETLGSQISGFETYINYLRMGETARLNTGISDDNFGKARAEFEAGIDEAKLRVIEQYNGDLEETVTLLSQLKKGGKEAANAVQTLDSKISQNAYNRWALDKYKSGDRSDTVLSQLSSGFGIDQGELKEATAVDATAFIATMEQELEGQTSDLTMTTGAMLTSMWEDVKNGLPDSFDYTPYVDVDGAVTDISGFVAALNATGDAAAQAFAALVARLSSLGASFKIGLDGSGISVSLGSASAKPKSSGGGGGGKSDADKLVDKIKKGQALYEHRIKMIQYKQTEYTNADELTNYGRMIEKEMEIERSYLPIIQENINKLKEQMAKTKVGSDDWYTLRDAILSAEETYEEINKTLDENKQKLEENQQAILKLHTDLEDSVTSEIQNRLQKERDMTDGAVSMQDTILNAIKQRYQDEWDRMVHTP